MSKDRMERVLTAIGLTLFILLMATLHLLQYCNIVLEFPIRLILSLSITVAGLLIAYLWLKIRNLEGEVLYLSHRLETLENQSDHRT